MNLERKEISKGDTFVTRGGCIAIVIENKGWDNVHIAFDGFPHGKTLVVEARNLRKGQVKNPLKPSKYGVGYLGLGKYKAWGTIAYIKWSSMLGRCYSKAVQKKQPTYVGCSVCPEWLDFQNFAEWFYSQPNHEDSSYALDKDICGNGLLYSPSTCVLVTQGENNAAKRQQEF